MALVVTQEGAQRLLQWLLALNPTVTPNLHLLGQPFTPAASTTISQLAAAELPGGGGYMPLALGPAKSVWTLSGLPDGAQALSVTFSWTFTGSATVYGYYVSDDSLPVSLWAEALGQSYPYPSGGVFSLQLPLDLTSQTAGPYAMLPSGVVLPFAGSTLPAGFLSTNGAAYPQSQYPSLFAAIGSAWNTFRGLAAPPGGQFRVPYLNGLAVIGAGGAVAAGGGVGATSSRALAVGLGEETHALTSAENGPVNAGFNPTGSFTQGFNGTVQHGAAGADFVAADGSAGFGLIAGISSASGGSPHNNIQPSAGLNYIIST